MRLAPLVLALAALAGCGGDDERVNANRPPSPINVTAAVDDDKVLVTPKRFGAGPIVIIVSNQSSEPQEVTFETNELAGESGGIQVKSRPIMPSSTGTVQVTPRPGTYRLRAGAGSIEPAEVRVGPARDSAQDDVLLP
jgi:hypothetical protein